MRFVNIHISHPEIIEKTILVWASSHDLGMHRSKAKEELIIGLTDPIAVDDDPTLTLRARVLNLK